MTGYTFPIFELRVSGVPDLPPRVYLEIMTTSVRMVQRKRKDFVFRVLSCCKFIPKSPVLEGKLWGLREGHEWDERVLVSVNTLPTVPLSTVFSQKNLGGLPRLSRGKLLVDTVLPNFDHDLRPFLRISRDLTTATTDTP